MRVWHRNKRKRTADDYLAADDERVATPVQRAKRIRHLRVKYWGSVILMWGVALACLGACCTYLFVDKVGENTYWAEYTPPSDADLAQQAQSIAEQKGAAQVRCGTYLENLESIQIKDGTYSAVWLVWFEWQDHDDLDFTDNFRVYKGSIDSLETVKNYTSDDGTHYQRFRIHTTISKVFWTPRFPLESHQLRMYLEPDYSIDQVNLVQSDSDSEVNPNMSIAGYDISRMNSGIEYIAYQNSFDDPALGPNDHVIKAEHMTQIEINRSGAGLYFKCFIALWATTLWVLLMLFAATRHRVDAFEYIPETLFGAAANILVGAELLPDSLQIGLLEFGNLWGIFIILIAAIAIMIINRERTYWQNEKFAEGYGRIILVSLAILAVIGNIALPVSAFLF